MKINKNTAAQFLEKTTPERAFWCSDGKIFHGLVEFGAGLKNMPEGIFRYHANSEKNDFSKWISDVIGDYELGEELARAKSKSEAARKVNARIAQLKKIVK